MRRSTAYTGTRLAGCNKVAILQWLAALSDLRLLLASLTGTSAHHIRCFRLCPLKESLNKVFIIKCLTCSISENLSLNRVFLNLHSTYTSRLALTQMGENCLIQSTIHEIVVKELLVLTWCNVLLQDRIADKDLKL